MLVQKLFLELLDRINHLLVLDIVGHDVDHSFLELFLSGILGHQLTKELRVLSCLRAEQRNISLSDSELFCNLFVRMMLVDDFVDNFDLVAGAERWSPI